jgi:hypothetical protein
VSFKKKHYFENSEGELVAKHAFSIEEAKAVAFNLTELTSRTWVITQCHPRCAMWHIRMVKRRNDPVQEQDD